MITPVHRFQNENCRNVNRPNVHRPQVHRSSHHHNNHHHYHQGKIKKEYGTKPTQTHPNVHHLLF